MPQTPATLTYIDSFETTSQWAFVNHTANSPTAWVIGNAVNNGGSKSLYVSTDNGLTNTIDPSVVSTVHTYRDVKIPIGTATLSFDWKAVGDFYNGGWGYQVYNFMQAWIVPKSYTPTGGNLVSGVANAIQLQGPHQDGNFLDQSTFTTFINSNVNLAAFAGDTVRLVFTWKTLNGTGGTPAAIDNIYFGTPIPTSADSVVISTANNVAPEITTQNGTIQLNANVWPATFSQNVTWTSTSGSAFATVDANGLVTGLSNGTATIRATSTASNTIFDEIQVLVNIPAAPVETCDTLTTFSFDFENFTAFPENCWSENQGSPMISLGNASGDNFIQVYSSTNANQDLFIVSPPVSTIDGQHQLSFDATSTATGLMVTFGTLATENDYTSFVPTGAAFAPVAGQTYTSANLTATPNHYYTAIKVSPNGVHKVVGIDNVVWKLGSGNVNVNELEEVNAVHVYPNPTNDFINIDSKVAISSVELYNVIGQMVHTSKKAMQINVSQLNGGVYFVKINSEKGLSKTFRVVKQ